MRVKKIIDGAVHLLAGTCQVAAQSGSDEIIVDDVGDKPWGIGLLRETLADALHGRPKLSGNGIFRRRGKPRGNRATSECGEQQRCGAQKRCATRVGPVFHSGSLGVALGRVAPPPRTRAALLLARRPRCLGRCFRRLVFGVRLILAGLHHRCLQGLTLFRRDGVIALGLDHRDVIGGGGLR